MVGEQVGSYRLLERLGSGGMGVVWRAEHVTIGRKAAIKMIRPDLSGNAVLTRRFFNEARSAAQVDHPGLVAIFDYGTHTDGSAYIVMELLAGETLGARLRRAGPLALAESVGLARQIAAPLAAVHDTGTVHRDLKPDNVFLVADAEHPLGVRVKVLDFGIAKLRDDLGGNQTGTGAVLGTPAYMAPEQCRGAGQVDLRADVYSLGCILFEMVCGRPPFVGQGFGALLGEQMYEAPPAPRTLQAAVPADLDALILRMLAKKPEERPSSMREVIAALEDIAPRTSRPLLTVEAARTVSAPGSVVPPTAPVRRRGPWRLVGTGLLLAAAVTAGVVYGTSARAPAPPARVDLGDPLVYTGDGVRFRYAPVMKLERSDDEGSTQINLEAPGSPLIVVQRYKPQVSPEELVPRLIEALEARMEAAQRGYELLGTEPVRRHLDRELIEGRRLNYKLAGKVMVTEIYALQRGLVTFSFIFQSGQSGRDDEAGAEALFRIFADSFRVTSSSASDAGSGR